METIEQIDDQLSLILYRLCDGIIPMKKALKQIHVITRKPALIPVNDWPKYHKWPTVSALRTYIFHAKEYGFEDCVVRRNRKVFIREDAFRTWMETFEEESC